MIINKVCRNCCKTIFVLASMMLLSIGSAYCAGSPAKTDPNEWKKVIEAAKKEGKIVISGGPSEEWRKSLVDMFMLEYPDINVQYTGINARDFWPRVRQERELGQKLWDLRTGGVDSNAFNAKRDGLLDPIRPLLLPEIADDSKWIGGLNLLFYDKEKKYNSCYSMYIQRTVAVNHEFIKESELKSSAQLLDQKYRGKIVIQTPTSGASFQALANLAFMYGENFFRELLSKQNMIITNDNRQQAEWVVRGKYPITIGLDNTQLIPFQKEGLGKNIAKLEDNISPVTNGFGGISLFKDAPHPNAARVYINWLLSKNIQIKLSKNVLLNSLRTDVPIVDKVTAVDPAHLNKYRFYSTEENVEIDSRLLPIIKEVMKY